MILIVCVDDRNGMLFHERRQSQDRLLREHILKRTSGNTLWMNRYSYGQFREENCTRIKIWEHFPDGPQPGEYCFVEDMDVAPYESLFEKIILYKWNRQYPSDLSFSLDLSGWVLTESLDFAGSSHERITEEVYIK